MKNKILQKKTYSRFKAITATSPEQTFRINVAVVAIAVFALVAHALLINHLNTINFKLTDLRQDALSLTERNSELEARISESQTLGSIEERAVELGMIAVEEYTFLTSVDTVVAKR